MTDNEKNIAIAEWAGLKPAYLTTHGTRLDQYGKPMQDYLNTNAAFDILDVLVEKELRPTLEYKYGGWSCSLWKLEKVSDDHYEVNFVAESYGNKSKSRAICEAVLALREKEKGQ